MPLLSIADLEQTQATLLPFLGVANNLSSTYYEYIAKSQNDTYSYKVDVFGAKTRAAGIHASEISKCLRLMVYSINGEERIPNDQNVNMLMRFRLGTAVHAMVQNDWHRIAEKSGGFITFEDEVKIHPRIGGAAEEWNLHSSCDGVITIWGPNDAKVLVPMVRVGLEIKTASDKEFDKLRGPMSDHEEQTCFYMKALDLPLMWVLYYNKSNSNISPSKPPYIYQFNRELWEQLEMRFVEATHLAETKTLPPREEGFQCEWCAYAHTCKPEKLQRKQQQQAPIVISQGMRARKT